MGDFGEHFTGRHKIIDDLGSKRGNVRMHVVADQDTAIAQFSGRLPDTPTGASDHHGVTVPIDTDPAATAEPQRYVCAARRIDRASVLSGSAANSWNRDRKGPCR